MYSSEVIENENAVDNISESIEPITDSIDSYNMEVFALPSTTPIEVEQMENIEAPSVLTSTLIQTSVESYYPNPSFPSSLNFPESYGSREIRSKTVEKTQEWETVSDLNDVDANKKTFGIKLTRTTSVSFCGII